MLRAITLPCYTNDSGFIVCTNKIISVHYISGQLIASFEILQRIISCNMETEGACNLILFRNIIDLESITLQQPFRKLCRAGVATACQEESSSALSKHRGDKNSSSQKTVLQNAQHICVRGAFMLKCVAHLFSWNPAGVSHRDSSCVSYLILPLLCFAGALPLKQCCCKMEKISCLSGHIVLTCC